jgi:hypothetical protein
MPTTKHTCNGPVFGRLTEGCARCDELRNGATPIRWKKSNDEQRRDEIRAHFAPNGRHALGLCGPVCTFGDP